MDELRSSDALEREIRDDSRKKAERLLKQAEADMKAVLDSSSEKAAKEVEQLRLRYGEKGGAYRAEVMARLPLEKKRRRIEWAEGRLNAALSQALSRTDDAGLLGLLLPTLRRSAPFFLAGGYSVSCSGFEPNLVAARLKDILPGFSPSLLKSAQGARGIAVTSSDGRLEFRMDEESARSLLADKYRQELAQSLLGKVEEL